MSRLLVLVCLLLGGCSLHMQVPEGFLRQTPRGAEALSAITPEGFPLRVHEFAVEDASSIEFWAKALETEFGHGRGYQLDAGAEVRDGAGRIGRAFTGQTVAEGQPCGYFLAVFLVPGGLFTGDVVRIAEFAAPKAEFDARLGAVRTAITTLQ